jgi:hypothetical protein
LNGLRESFQEYTQSALRTINRLKSLAIVLGTTTAGGALFILFTIFGR